jgi:Zn-dependent alcohol dehydrogenase
MVTHRFPLAEANAALDSTANGEGIKVVVVP